MLGVLGGVSIGILFLFYLFEFATELSNDKNRFIASSVLFAISAILIFVFDVTSVKDELSAYLVAVFVVTGIYFFYSVTTWIRRNAN